ncbi:hypothetical protein [Acidipila sp. EB88]|uniref:hypothetical protein n=1 Tax=Acidipila sp. EB88 TaxID=2305226 RepID=UPI000F6033C5|nr:hypothetical protein [Acidipila sp. EB88]RRA48495.1 hypothetical protein D1Y84_09535 [Acidipila sp. EB88]
MDREKQARKRFAEKKWDSLEQMVLAYADEAIHIARSDFHEEIDHSIASLPRLERILNRLCPAPEPIPSGDSDWLVLLWGSYFGELLRATHGGTWEMSIYPGTDFSVPALEIGGSYLYPMMKVHRRLSLGAAEELPAFYAMLRARLEAPRQKPAQ